MSQLHVEELEPRRLLNASRLPCIPNPEPPVDRQSLAGQRPPPPPDSHHNQDAAPPSSGDFGHWRPDGPPPLAPPGPQGAGPAFASRPPIAAFDRAAAGPDVAGGASRAAPPIARLASSASAAGAQDTTDEVASGRVAPAVTILAPPSAPSGPAAPTGASGIAAPDATPAGRGATPMAQVTGRFHHQVAANPDAGAGGTRDHRAAVAPTSSLSLGAGRDDASAALVAVAHRPAPAEPAMTSVRPLARLEELARYAPPLVGVMSGIPTVALATLEQGVREFVERIERDAERVAEEGMAAGLSPWVVAGAAAALACELARRQVRRPGTEPARGAMLFADIPSRD